MWQRGGVVQCCDHERLRRAVAVPWAYEGEMVAGAQGIENIVWMGCRSEYPWGERYWEAMRRAVGAERPG